MILNDWTKTEKVYAQGDTWLIPDGTTDVILQNYPHPAPKVVWPASLKRAWIDCETFANTFQFPYKAPHAKQEQTEADLRAAQYGAMWQLLRSYVPASVEMNMFAEAPMLPADVWHLNPDPAAWHVVYPWTGADAHGVPIDNADPVRASNLLRAVLRCPPNKPVRVWMRPDTPRESFFRAMLLSGGVGMVFDADSTPAQVAAFAPYRVQMEAVLKGRDIVKPIVGDLQDPSKAAGTYDAAVLSDGATLVRFTGDKPLTIHVNGVAVACVPDDGGGCWREVVAPAKSS